ncbi:universal stress protein UspA [Aerococcus urinaehominis]|uniref:Universal stress protein n=1 Tax=Aerococcus urinaehominis TaxID=128944 RepID=A0A0X8FLY3_9LACT|nr:universal stress protein [Aerococcus urinaehominis]AMB99753.1 universal stress protein UspA [Aerococcus urinaehominis]
MFQEYKHILAPIDGSEEAELAFKKAIEVAKRNQASLTIAHIIDTRAVATPGGYEGNFIDDLEAQAEKLLASYQAEAAAAGLDQVTTLVDYGSPKVQIVKQIVPEEQIDLIMLGATGLNAVERLFIGSVSDYVIRHAPCDVLVVRTDLENKISE